MAQTPDDGFFARRGDVAISAGVFGAGGGGISHVGARYWASDRVALGAEVGEATLDVGDSEADTQRFPSYLTMTHTQSLSLWAERHIDTPLRPVSLLAGLRAYGGLQSRDASRYLMAYDCSGDPCRLVGFSTSAREEAVTGGLSALLGYELRVYGGLTLGVTSEVGVARTSARLVERWEDRDPERSERATWHTVRDARILVSVYL